MLLVLLLGGAWLARINLRAGRGDRKGAMRLAAAAFVVEAAMWALGSHHSGGLAEAWNLIGGFSNCAAMAAGLWIVYIALEPFARRRWPQMLISWTRVLSGQWRDPLVGRDVLVGTVAGAAVGLLLGPIRVLLPPLLHLPARAPHPFAEAAPSNPMLTVAWMLSDLVSATIWILAIVFFLVLVRIVVRRGWIAGLVVVLIFTANFLGDQPAVVTLPLAVLSIGVIIGVTIRYGVLAGIVAEVCRHLSGYGIYTTDPSSWYFYASVIALAVLLGLAFWATKTALAGQPLFGGLALEEKTASD